MADHDDELIRLLRSIDRKLSQMCRLLEVAADPEGRSVRDESTQAGASTARTSAPAVIRELNLGALGGLGITPTTGGGDGDGDGDGGKNGSDRANDESDDGEHEPDPDAAPARDRASA